jgi:hypothetical protein
MLFRRLTVEIERHHLADRFSPIKNDIFLRQPVMVHHTFGGPEDAVRTFLEANKSLVYKRIAPFSSMDVVKDELKLIT